MMSIADRQTGASGGGAAEFRDAPEMPAGPFHRFLGLIGPVLRPAGDAAEASAPSLWWIALLSLGSAGSLLAIAIAHHGGYHGKGWAAPLLWASFAALFLPPAMRAAWPRTARGERIALLLLLAACSYGIRQLHAPTGFAYFDEFLHWITALDIVESRRLFLPNSQLPISPLYPGLELVATAVVEMTGLSIFAAATILLFVLRLLLVAGLFALYERVSGSARLATVACLVYMGNSGFIFFEGQFAYESLALVLFVFGLLAAALFEAEDAARMPVACGLVAPFFAVMAVTHHMSAYFAATFMLLLAALGWGGLRQSHRRLSLIVFAALALALPLLWSWLLGNPGKGYLGPILESGAEELARLLGGAPRTKELFVLPGGQQTPLWLRVTSILSLLLIAAGLSTGFLRGLALAADARGGWPALWQCARLRWTNHWLLLLTLVSIGLPISVGFRLTTAGWEIGNRMGPFVFLGVGFVIAVSILHVWQPARSRRAAALVTGLALTVCFVAGIVTGWGVQAIRSPYRVSADAASIERMGIEASRWTREWLGAGNRFTADRVNRLLLATYGRQYIVTSLNDHIDTSGLFMSEAVTAGGIHELKQGRIDYLLVDFRLTTARPTLGHYYEHWEHQEGPPRPLDAEAFLKFNQMPGTDRLFDNGFIAIFGVGGLRHGG